MEVDLGPNGYALRHPHGSFGRHMPRNRITLYPALRNSGEALSSVAAYRKALYMGLARATESIGKFNIA